MLVGLLARVRVGRDLAELLSELMLPHVEVGRLLAHVRHLAGLQWRHLLLDGDADLLGVVPLLGQLLNMSDCVGMKE